MTFYTKPLDVYPILSCIAFVVVRFWLAFFFTERATGWALKRSHFNHSLNINISKVLNIVKGSLFSILPEVFVNLRFPFSAPSFSGFSSALCVKRVSRTSLGKVSGFIFLSPCITKLKHFGFVFLSPFPRIGITFSPILPAPFSVVCKAAHVERLP